MSKVQRPFLGTFCSGPKTKRGGPEKGVRAGPVANLPPHPAGDVGQDCRPGAGGHGLLARHCRSGAVGHGLAARGFRSRVVGQGLAAKGCRSGAVG